MVKLAVVVTTMNEVGDDRADRRRGSADSNMVSKTVQHAKRRDCHLEIEIFNLSTYAVLFQFLQQSVVRNFVKFF